MVYISLNKDLVTETMGNTLVGSDQITKDIFDKTMKELTKVTFDKIMKEYESKESDYIYVEYFNGIRLLLSEMKIPYVLLFPFQSLP